MKLFALVAAVGGLTAAAMPAPAAETNVAATLTIGAAQAAAHVGQQVTVTGLVAQVSSRPGIVFLNFDKRYPDSPFTAIIRGRSTNEFENVSALKGRSVAVKGEVKDFHGKPEIELLGKHQLQILETPK